MMTLRLARLAVVLSCAGLLPGQSIFVSTATSVPAGNDATGDGTAAKPYRTVTFATSVAPAGATLQLSPGVHGLAEQIEFTNKDINLNGLGTAANPTIIRGHATLTKSYPVGTPPGVPDLHRVGITVNGPARVNVTNLTIDMNLNYANIQVSGRLYGMLFLNGGDGSLVNVEIMNMRAVPYNGQPSVGLVIRGDNPGDPSDVTIHKCFIHDFSKAGVAAAYNSTLTMDETVVRGGGQLPAAGNPQNAVQVTHGATCVLRNNVVKDVFWIPVTNSAVGILLLDHGPNCLVENNSINSCQSGILVFRTVSATVPTIVRGNQVTESAFGIECSLNKGVTVTNNVIHGATNETAFDDSPGNSWSGNNYSDWPGAGTYAILGGAGNVDTTPRRGYDALGAASTVVVGGSPVDMVVANFGGSAALDFATVNESLIANGLPSISVGIAGAFPAYTVTTTTFGVGGEQPSAICTGNFDGANGPDVAVVTLGRNFLYVFLNNGLGNFGIPAAIPLPGNILDPYDVAAGDMSALSAAGRDDIVIAALGGLNAAGGGFYLRNLGAGTAYAAPVALPGPFTGQCKGIAVGFINANGTRGVAITEGTGNFGRVHLYGHNGLGVFNALAGSPYAVPSDPTSIFLADLNGDTKLDCGVTCTNAAVPIVNGAAAFLINNLPTGFNVTVHRTLNGAQSIAFGDLNNDSGPGDTARDVAIVDFTTSRVSILTSFGKGGFTGNFEALAGTTPRACVLASMNGDAYGDLVVADASNQTVRIILGIPKAANSLYGFGCPGTSNKIPIIQTTGTPALAQQPNLTFGIGVTNGLPLAFAALIASAAPFPGPYTPVPCQFLLASADVAWSTITNAVGAALVPLPIPATPNLVGGTVYFQWGILDPNGGFPGPFALSEGLKVRVGL